MNRYEEIAKGDRAKAIIEDTMVQDALQTIKTTIRDQVFLLPIESRDQREFLVMMDRARQQFERCFELLIQGAQIQKAEIAQEEQLQARLDGLRTMTRAR